MSLKTLQQMPSAETIKESPHTLDFIRRRISGIFQNDILDDNGQLAILELILCLANEISDLKQQNIATLLGSLPDNDRLGIISKYCKYCGQDESKSKCYCAPHFDE